MTTIKTIEKKTFNGKDSYTISFEDGEKGYLEAKGSDKDLKQGESVSYNKEIKQNKKGENYNLFTVTRAGSSSATPPTPGLPSLTAKPAGSKITHKVEASIRVFEACMEVYGNERQGFDWNVLMEKQKEVARVLWSQIDEIYSEN
jgi:hypothetical protein